MNNVTAGSKSLQHADNRRPGRVEITSLTSLRAFAALHVVLFHTTFELSGVRPASLPRVVLNVLGCGQAAVSFFFILSGFILAYTYCEPDGAMSGTRRRFWRARFARIYPLYLLSFVLDAPRAIMYFAGSSGSATARLSKGVVSGVAFLALIQSWLPRITSAWNAPAWSLSTEAFFYLAFPALLIVTRRLSPGRIVGAGLIGWAAVTMFYFGLVVRRPELVEGPWFHIAWRSLPPLRLPEFLLGIGIGRFHASGARRSEPWIRSTGVASCLGIFLLFSVRYGVPNELLVNSLGAPLFAGVILALASGRLPAAGWLATGPWPLLGRASYAVYILHQPFKSWFLRVTDALGIGTSPMLLAAYVLVLQVFCVGALKVVEEPARRFLTVRPGGLAAKLLPPSRKL
jgi:peptidoglycan/LPS O-acetylase OafA/YrhL